MKILIFYGSYGGGHLSAAKAIKEYIDSNYQNSETMLVDCIEYVNKTLNKVTTLAYEEMAKKAPKLWGKVYSKAQKGYLAKISTTSNNLMSTKLNTLLDNFKPNLVISTHPFATQMCARIKKKNKNFFKLATILTDYAPHDQWLVGHQFCDYFFVAHAQMKEYLANKGIPNNKIYDTGIPLSTRFLGNFNKEETLASFNLQPNKTTILFFAGGQFGLGKGKTYQILESLITSFPDFQIIAISGKNPKMKQQFDNLVSEHNSASHVKVLEFTNKVPELMNISDLVITKPGGLTTTESLACGLPIIVVNPIPGQEEENAEFLEKSKVAIWLKSIDNMKTILELLFDHPEKINEMKANTKLLAKKNSTKDICEILLGH